MNKEYDFGDLGMNQFGPTPPEVLKLRKIIEPWLETCSGFIRSEASMEAHMEQAARVYDIRDLVDIMEAKYRELALRAVEITCVPNIDAFKCHGIIAELDELANTTTMWPHSWPKWVVKTYMRISIVAPCTDMESIWKKVIQELDDFKIPPWLQTDVPDKIRNPVTMIKDIMNEPYNEDPAVSACYETCCRQWILLVKEGMAESEAGMHAITWFNARKITPLDGDKDVDLDALIGPTPADMPMDGKA